MTENSTGLGDFIFGTLATTANRVEALNDVRRGLSAPSVEQREDGVWVTLTAGPDAPVDHVVLYFTTDGSDLVPDETNSHAQMFMEMPPVWDTLLWCYLRRFEVTIPAMLLPKNAPIRMRAIGYTRNDEAIPAVDGQRFTFLTESHPVPTWLRKAIIYQVFVDRFSTDGGKPFTSHDDLAGFYGGTIRGVTERLDYLSDLDVDAIWLSPIFPSPSHHGYDSTDFTDVEPRLGSKADLRALVEAAHARGIGILLDFVPNHVSNAHPFFRSAQTDPESPYRDYFTFAHWPDDYRTFFDVKSLPQLANDRPGARQYVIASAQYWLREFGIDGYRLDYAYGPSQDFWADYYTAVKKTSPNSAHFGEIVETPELIRSYAGRMDGALDFHFVQAVRKTFAYDTMTIEAFDDWLTRHMAYFARHEFVLPSFLDNHDMNRFLWATRGDVQRLKLAALVQFTLPAPPIIYYGTETGLNQIQDVRNNGLEQSRVPMNWNTLDNDLVAFYKKLIAARRVIADALNGVRTTLIADRDGHYAYGYYADVGPFNGTLSVLTLINHSPYPNTFRLDSPGAWRDLFSNEKYPDAESHLITLAPETGSILVRG